MPQDRRLPPMPTGRASEEPPTQFDQRVPEGWLTEEAVPTSKRPINVTQRLDVVVPVLPQPSVLATLPKASGPGLSPISRLIAAGCLGFVIGMAVTATMAMTIRPSPPPCTESPR